MTPWPERVVDGLQGLLLQVDISHLVVHAVIQSILAPKPLALPSKVSPVSTLGAAAELSGRGQGMSEDDPALTAVCNLVAALGMAMVTGGRASELRTLLGMFDSMNEATIKDAAALAKLKTASNAQRAVMEQMPR